MDDIPDLPTTLNSYIVSTRKNKTPNSTEGCCVL